MHTTTHQPRSLASLWSKQANAVLPAPAAPGIAPQNKQDALKQLLQIAGIGLGTGIAGRSLIGLGQRFSEPTVAPGPLGPTRPEVLLPNYGEEEEKIAGSFSGPIDTAKNYLANLLPDITTAKPLGDWWGPAAAAGTGVLALGTGYGLTDKVLGAQRSADHADEVADAENEYNQAMAEEYEAAMRAKNAGDDLGIDSLFDLLLTREKKAEGDALGMVGKAVNRAGELAVGGHDNWQYGKGLGLAAMLATALGTGYATYNWTKDKTNQQALQQAMKIRARQRAMTSPAPLMLLPPQERGYAANAA